MGAGGDGRGREGKRGEEGGRGGKSGEGEGRGGVGAEVVGVGVEDGESVVEGWCTVSQSIACRDQSINNRLKNGLARNKSIVGFFLNGE